MTLTKDIKNQEAFFIRLDILEITRFPKTKPILLSDTNTNYWLNLHVPVTQIQHQKCFNSKS